MELEEVEDPLQELLEVHNPAVDESEAEELEEPPPPPIPSVQDALKGLQLLLRFRECQADSQRDKFRMLFRLEKDIRASMERAEKQATLDSWFSLPQSN